MVDELRYLANWALARSAESLGDGDYSPPALVESVSVASPALVALTVSDIVGLIFPGAVIGGVIAAVKALPAWRKTWYEGTGQKLDNTFKRLELEDRVQERSRAKGGDRAELDAIREQEREAEDELIASITGVLSSATGLSGEDSDHLAGLARRRVLPVVESLASAGVEDIEEIQVRCAGRHDACSVRISAAVAFIELPGPVERRITTRRPPQGAADAGRVAASYRFES